MVLAITALLLVPCFWQPHIQAGDLSSHLYNAWLTSEIQRGRIDGFEIVPVWTNVLTDWILAAAVPAVGTIWSARLVTAPAVLIFFWGAFFALDAAGARRPWRFCPVLALFTYGLVFHLGFLNFYLSTGLSLWVLGLLLNPTASRLAAVVPLSILAVLSHAFPVIWVAGVFAYVRIGGGTSAFLTTGALAKVVRRKPQGDEKPGRWGAVTFAAGLGAIVGARLLLSRLPHRWSWDQILSFNGFASLTAVEQVWLYDGKYLLISAGLACAFFILLVDRLRRDSAVADPWFQIWILHLFSLMILPASIQLPQYDHALAYIPQRLSLFTGLAFCLAVCNVRTKPAREPVLVSGMVVVAFFAFLFVDDRAYNRLEADVTRVVRTAPSGARVVASLRDQGVRVNAMAHVADRACIGHCFSYANYEAPTKQFRIRLRPGNRVNASSVAVSRAIDDGDYVVSTADDPIYSVCACDARPGTLCLRTLHAGERVCTVARPISIRLWE